MEFNMSYYLTLNFDLVGAKSNDYNKVEAFIKTMSFTKDSTKNTYISDGHELDGCAEHYFPNKNPEDVQDEDIIKEVIKQDTNSINEFLVSEGITGSVKIYAVDDWVNPK